MFKKITCLETTHITLYHAQYLVNYHYYLVKDIFKIKLFTIKKCFLECSFFVI